MQAGCSVGVVVPAYNEERQIGRVLETMPQFVDHIIVVDDRSSDATLERCREWQDRLGRRLTVIEQPKNLGVGAAITSGYRRAVDIGLDVVAVMAGDGQMDPNDLTLIIDPVISGKADYSKGNRLFTGEAWRNTPHVRYLGNAFLSMLTKIASGYWHVARDHRSRSNHRETPDADPREHHRAPADGRSMADDGFAHSPVTVRFESAVGIDGAWVLVVEEHHSRAKEDAVLEVEAMKYKNAVLQLAPVADPDVDIDVRALAQDALAPDDGAFAYLDLTPDPGLRPNLGAV